MQSASNWKRLLLLSSLVIWAAPAPAVQISKYPSLVAITCSGNLIDMRRIGVRLGNCNLNSLSAEDFKKVTDVCGLPGTIDHVNNQSCGVLVYADKLVPHVAYKVLAATMLMLE